MKRLMKADIIFSLAHTNRLVKKKDRVTLLCESKQTSGPGRRSRYPREMERIKMITMRNQSQPDTKT